jgi:hypothetical protein
MDVGDWWETQRGPLLGVAIATALIVVLAAVVTMLVLSVGEVSDGEGPSGEFEMNYDTSADSSMVDSFGNTGGNFDGLLRITYDGGDSIELDELVLTGASAEPGRAPFAPDGGFAVDERIEAGDTLTVWVDTTDEVTVIWEDIETGESTTLDVWSRSRN